MFEDFLLYKGSARLWESYMDYEHSYSLFLVILGGHMGECTGDGALVRPPCFWGAGIGSNLRSNKEEHRDSLW